MTMIGLSEILYFIIKFCTVNREILNDISFFIDELLHIENSKSVLIQHN